MKVITTAELKQKVDSGTNGFYLVDVLAPASFAVRHVPGALNIPKGGDFVERFAAATAAPKDA